MSDFLLQLSADTIRYFLLVSVFVFLVFLIFKKTQSVKLNWGLFYSFLWVSCSLLLINYFSVQQGYWRFQEKSLVLIPVDVFFVWVVLWGVLVPFFAQGKYIAILAVLLFWIDLLLMPLLEPIGILTLGENWLMGELLLIGLVFLPSQIWFHFHNTNTHIGGRSFFQVLVMAFLLLTGLPFLVGHHIGYSVADWSPFGLQILFILALPSLVAVVDLVGKGRGTPFPYDPTTQLVQSGVYAYIRNPIQWSFTWSFVPLALIYQSPFLLLGIPVSIAYVIGVSNVQEKSALQERYGQAWINYAKDVPVWYFQWKPTTIPTAKIYFSSDCGICASFRKWLAKKHPCNLIFMDAKAHSSVLESLRYVGENGVEYSSVAALASGLEHINLFWASIAWMMRLPGILHILQIIVDTMEIGKASCQIER